MRPHPQVWEQMRQFTDQRNAQTPDEVWFVEHPPVYTLGLRADRTHILDARDIPVVATDRGGQVTYHGPGQLVVYPLLDLSRLGLGVRALVQALEESVIDTVAGYGVVAHGRRDAPGVYVGEKKLAALGIRIRRHCSYHGIAINVAMDLEPFSRINPCGYAALEVTQLSELGVAVDIARLADDLSLHLAGRLGYRSAA
jgi:lipoyl(octanoyl) transferase